MNRSKKLNNWYLLISIVIFALLILSRFLYIGWRPAHHDEGMLAYFAYQLAYSKDYVYTPQIHGPVLFYLTALVFRLTLFKGALRVSMAVCGVILGSVSLLFFRKESKKIAVSIAGLILVSPLLTYYSRFLVHTGIVVLFNVCFILFFRNFWRNFKPLNLYLSALFLALAFGTSETSYIFCAIGVAFIPILFLLNRPVFLERWVMFVAFLKKNIFDLLSAILIFLIAWLLIYSVGLTNLESLKISLPNPFDTYYGLGFWLAQHKVRLGGQPWFYYLILSFVYELPATLSFLYFIPRIIKNRRPFELFLAWWTIGTFVGFSWAGEKFPWLFVPSLIAITFTSGYYIGKYWSELSKYFKIALLVLVVWTAFISVKLNFFNSDNTAELPVYVQTPRSFEKLEDKMKNTCQGKNKDCVLIDPKITWPLSWDFNDNGRLEEFSAESNLQNTNFALVSPESNQDAFDLGWKKETVQLRDWWVPDKCGLKAKCIGEYLDYFINRKIWSPKGGFDILLFTRESQ